MESFSREHVLKKLSDAFPDHGLADQALHALDRYGSGPNEPATTGVQLAIIKLSGGSVAKVRDLVHKARRDFRDVLYPAQAPELFHQLRDPKRLTPSEQRAMDERDRCQWLDWLAS
jgi:hypothetical protein